MTIQNVLDWLQEAEDNNCWQVSTQSVKRHLEEVQKQQLILPGVSKRYDVSKYTPPFRAGRKQGKAVLDGKGLEVVFFMHSEEQAKMYCDYLNNVC